MKVVQFYLGEIPNDQGCYLDDILKYSHEELEEEHTYIQWLLPTNEPSMYNPDAPVLTEDEISLFSQDPILRSRYAEAVVKMLGYFGMELVDEQVRWKPDQGTPWWIRSFNHNYLRMTRFITSLRLMGLEHCARSVFSNLQLYRHLYDDTTHSYWCDASARPLS